MTTKPPVSSALPKPNAMVRGLAIFRFGGGEPLLLMPYPHADAVVGDRALARIIGPLVDLGRSVITFDPPGSGQSTRPMRLTMGEMLQCAEEALAAAGVTGPADVFGHSQGGTTALAFALDRPERVRRLVLVGTGAGGPSFMRARGAIWNRTHPEFPWFAAMATLYWLTRRRALEILMLNVIQWASFADRRWHDPLPLHWRDWLRPARPRTRWGSDAAIRLDYRSRLNEIRAPVLILTGRHDPQMPPACGDELVAAIPEARQVMFERSGHYPFVEEPEAFWPAVAAFLAQPPPSR